MFLCFVFCEHTLHFCLQLAKRHLTNRVYNLMLSMLGNYLACVERYSMGDYGRITSSFCTKERVDFLHVASRGAVLQNKNCTHK